MIRSILPLAILMMTACSSSADAEAAYSALPEIQTLRPVIACIEERVESTQEEEVWSGGAPKGPAQSRETLKACASDLDLDFGRLIQAGDPHAARDAVMFWAIMSFGDYRNHLRVADFDSAMKAARCVEVKVTDGQGLSGEASDSREEVTRQALRECVPGVAEMEANPATAISRRDGLAFSIARININHIRSKMGTPLGDSQR